MRSDTIHISSTGEGISEALTQAEKVSAYISLDKKDAIHLRLFTEEMMGLMRARTGENEADFWIEAHNGRCELHLKVLTLMDAEKRKGLISVSSSGKNSAAKGFMGKIKDVFEKAFEHMDAQYSGAAGLGVIPPAAAPGEPMGGVPAVWSLSSYRDFVKRDDDCEKWDELEKSVVAKLADEVKVFINGSNVEMVIEKTFER